jgi:hypothetical protein
MDLKQSAVVRVARRESTASLARLNQIGGLGQAHFQFFDPRWLRQLRLQDAKDRAHGDGISL